MDRLSAKEKQGQGSGFYQDDDLKRRVREATHRKALNLGEGTVSIKSIKTVSRRVAELAGKNKKLVNLNPDLIRPSLRSLRL